MLHPIRLNSTQIPGRQGYKILFFPLQLINVATIAAVFRLRKRALENRDHDQYLTPGYPVVPLIFIVVMTLLMVNAAVYNPLDTFIGLALTALGLPVYLWIARGSHRRT